ncbi:hypothetical protein [Methylobacterium crusticola]|nr:hypothetical protein [Methylobacterium crusticola]
MNDLRNLTDQELDSLILGELGAMTAEHGSIMGAVSFYRSLGLPDFDAHADLIENSIPVFQEMIERRHSAEA